MLILIAALIWGGVWLWPGLDINSTRLAQAKADLVKAADTNVALRTELDQIYADRDDPVDPHVFPRARRNRHAGVTVVQQPANTDRPARLGAAR